MAISFFTASCNPSDNGTLATKVVSAQILTTIPTGSLVVMYDCNRAAGTHTITSNGGQTWNNINSNSATVNAWWTTFNGNWSGSLQTSCTTFAGRSLILIAFTSSLNYNWAVENTNISGSLAAAGTGPYAIPGSTTTNDSTVTVALWSTSDDNSWTSLSSPDGNWTKTGLDAQYRNLGGTDSSYTLAYNIRTAPGTVGPVSQSQVTVTGDATLYKLFTFYEYFTAPPTSPIFIAWTFDE